MSTDNKSVESLAALIEERIAPVIALDGGQIELVQVDEDAHRVTVRFGGSYRGSPCRGVVLDFLVAPVIKEAFDTSYRVEMAD